MGQKVNPHGLRVGVIKDWDSRWYASEEKVGDLIVEDQKVPAFPRLRSSAAMTPLPSTCTAPVPVLSSARAVSRSSSIVWLWRR